MQKQLRRSFKEAAKASGGVLSRVLTTHHPRTASQEHHPMSSGGEEGLWSSADFEVLSRLQHHRSPDFHYALNRTISNCAKLESLLTGVQLHSSVIKMGFCSNVFISTALVCMYCKCGVILSARQLFDEVPERNVVTWNSLISGYLQVQSPENALGLFLGMLKLGIAPTQFSLSPLLVGCSQLRSEKMGVQAHGFILKYGFYFNAVVATGLIVMYSKCANVGASLQVFREMPDRTVHSWTSMVTGLAQNQKPKEAIVLFKEMQRLGLGSNSETYNNLLSSFCCPDYLDHCKQVHCQIIKEGFESNVYLGASLMTVYSQCGGSVEDLRRICLGITRWDQISWNAAIAGLSNIGEWEEALKFFYTMRKGGIDMNSFTFTGVLKAIGNVSALEEGKHVHALVHKSGCASNLCVQNGLVAMYSRCGEIGNSKRVFSSMNDHDVISWNSLLCGCASHGYGNEAVELFEQMRETEVTPDNATFLAVLSACSHAGLLDKGLEYFELMKNYALSEPPGIEHYACIVDLYSRAGHLCQAEAFINSMPINPGPSVYKTLLSACQVHGNNDVAKNAAEKLVELCPNDPSTYILLSNVFAAGGRWDDAARVRNIMRHSGVKKNPGYSWV